ncbi:MAG: GGDEF domain-containing protein [Proteobacteria bacterium]|nr:GGDEF domain-containing protein [Pseudomonadota bacterium]
MNIEAGLSPEILDSLYDGVYILGRDRKIEYWNQAAGRISGYPSAEALGKSCHDHILTHLNEEGQNICHTPLCPIDQAFSDGKTHDAQAYLQHKEGHRVPVEIRTIPILDARGETARVVEVFREHLLPEATRQRIAELEKLALIDSLTGLANRRFAEITIGSRLAETQRNIWPFGLLFLDIDNFKGINDNFGHDAGDRALMMIAKTLINTLRAYDFVSRWGGEEFVVLIVNANREKLLQVAEKLRLFMEKSTFPLGGTRRRVTVSIGAALARPEDSVEILVRRADGLMYQGKKAGGNCVQAESGLP